MIPGLRNLCNIIDLRLPCDWQKFSEQKIFFSPAAFPTEKSCLVIREYPQAGEDVAVFCGLRVFPFFDPPDRSVTVNMLPCFGNRVGAIQLSGSSDKSVLCLMKRQNFELEELGITISIGLPFHGFDFVVCAFQWSG